MEPLPGVPQPVERRYHGACCLNYGEDHPKLLISGGVDKYGNVQGDICGYLMLIVASGQR